MSLKNTLVFAAIAALFSTVTLADQPTSAQSVAATSDNAVAPSTNTSETATSEHKVIHRHTSKHHKKEENKDEGTTPAPDTSVDTTSK